MTSPIVSVIIPCYNAEKNLRQCIDSIRCQTLEQIEIICIDDGSTDTTMDILRDYQKKDSRIQVIQQKNAGAGAARNVGLDRAAGDYLSFLDADDFFEPEMLEKAVNAAENWKADYVVFRSDRYYPTQDRYEAIPWSVRNADLPPYMPFSYRQLTDNVFLSFVGWAWDKVFRRSFVMEHHLRFQEQRTTNDMLFVFSALICAKRIGVIQDVLAHQRRGSGDTLSVTREKSWHCFYDALIALRERLIQENVFWELEKDFINYSLHFCLWHLNSLAEPSHTLLKQKLCRAWFAELGIANKPESYFYNHSEYVQYRSYMKTHHKSNHDVLPIDTVENIADVDWAKYQLNQENISEIIGNSASAYKISIEFDQLRDRLMQDQNTWNKNKYGYWKYKYHNCQIISSHLDGPVKKEYRRRMGQEFKRGLQLNELYESMFSAGEWREICKMVNQSYAPITRIKKSWIMQNILAVLPDRIKYKVALRK